MARPPRKLVLAVQDLELRERLQALLSAESVEVEYVPELGGAQALEVDADVVVLRAEALVGARLPELLERAAAEESPGVVVLGEGEEAEEEVRLVAAGAAAVLDTGTGGSEFAEQLVELVEAEAEGGVQGPEASGAVAHPKLADFQSRSPRMRDFLDVVKRVAGSDSTLLIAGETGVGKERLARAIHAESPRASGPFVTLNCGALSENLLESELFGHERGAFTGAIAARKGHFEIANGGTVFLDEIGEMPPHLQVKLLTVLQRREVQPLGGRKPLPIDIRVIAATNRDLAADVAEGRFREDLLFRLNVVSLVIPPLRDRAEDLPWLVGRFLRHFTEAHDRASIRGIARDAMKALLDYSWPGNVRELVNVIERAVLLCEGDGLRLSDFPPALQGGGEPGRSSDSEPASELLALPLQEARRRVLEQFERRYLAHHLRQSRGVVGTVARRARINPRTLYEKMRRLGLRRQDFS